MTVGEFEALLSRVDALVAEFERHADPAVRQLAMDLLHGIDAVHREGIARLVDLLNRRFPRLLEEAAANDPVIRLLLVLYDLAPSASPTPAFIPLERLQQSAALARTRRKTSA
jgi:hypothetical protein